MLNNSITVKEIAKKDNLKNENTEIVIRMKYPEFSCDDKNSKKVTDVCEKINQYYSKIAQTLSDKAKMILSSKKSSEKNTEYRKSTVEMNYKISLCNDKYISVVLDIGFCNKKCVRKKRFSQVWSICDGYLLPVCCVMKTNLRTKKKMLSFILENAKQNAYNPAFGYFDDYLSRLRHSFSMKRFFITEKGIAFYAGILSDIKYGSFAFVVPYEKMSEILKIRVTDADLGKQNEKAKANDEKNSVK